MDYASMKNDTFQKHCEPCQFRKLVEEVCNMFNLLIYMNNLTNNKMNIDFFDIRVYPYYTFIIHKKHSDSLDYMKNPNKNYNYTYFNKNNTRTIIHIDLFELTLKSGHAVCLIIDKNIGYYYDSNKTTFGYFFNKKLLQFLKITFNLNNIYNIFDINPNCLIMKYNQQEPDSCYTWSHIFKFLI